MKTPSYSKRDFGLILSSQGSKTFSSHPIRSSVNVHVSCHDQAKPAIPNWYMLGG